MYVDVSASNQPFRTEVVALCRKRLTFLNSRDAIADAQFADQAALWQNLIYQPQQQNELRKRCDRILEPDPSIGKALGTSLMTAIQNWATQVHHLQLQNKQAAIVAIFVIQAAEVAEGQSAIDWQQIKQWIQKSVSNHDAVLIVGSEAALQGQWTAVFQGIPEVRIIPYRDSDNGLKWAFDLARKP
ncbi:hypothetical protein IQ250_28055 [Pseudanabaenaceae cyanobacterium LEGE 13415]|nr:hypothetical protein [Pseudanabaenaceae cyanobacterium LEGE 13415]